MYVCMYVRMSVCVRVRVCVCVCVCMYVGIKKVNIDIYALICCFLLY